MIVYRELSSLQKDLGISLRTLYSVSNSITKHYRKKTIPKSNGEARILYVPSDALKRIQRKISDILLARMDVSPYAAAYRPGFGPAANALPHIGQPILLKLDIRHFFDSIIYSSVKKYAFPEEIYSESARVLLSLLCTYKGALPQGAPSSPAISNLILKEFDNTLGPWCNDRGIAYTRYCDDMTFSGDFDPFTVIGFVKTELRRYGFFLNDKKTKILRNGQRKTVTGYVVNDKLNTASGYRRQLRQEMYYCMKYGLTSHLEHTGTDCLPLKYASSLLGRVNFVLTADSNDSEFLKYKGWLTKTVAELAQSEAPTAKEAHADSPAPAGSTIVHVPCFGDIDISMCPTRLNTDGMEERFLEKAALSRFVANNFLTFQRAGRNYAVCCGENSLAAIILIVDGIFHTDFFYLAKELLCDNGRFWRTIGEKTLGADIRNNFPKFYFSLLTLFKELKLLYSGMAEGDESPAAIVIPDYVKLISGWLPRGRKKEILQRGLGLLAGEKNGMILECLYGVELTDDSDHVLGKITNYKNGIFTLKCRNGREITRSVEDCEFYLASAPWNPDFDEAFETYIELIKEIESKVEYDRIGDGKENDGLYMRDGGYKGVIYKMKT